MSESELKESDILDKIAGISARLEVIMLVDEFNEAIISNVIEKMRELQLELDEYVKTNSLGRLVRKALDRLDSHMEKFNTWLITKGGAIK